MAEKLRVAVAGAGWVATHRHLPAYRSHPGCDVVAIYDRDVDRARAVASRENAQAVSSIAALLATTPDVVSICTSPWTHVEFGTAALEAGAHVFCEKPMALSEGEAATMAKSAGASGRLLCVSHNFLYSRAVRKADAFLQGQRTLYALATQVTSHRRRLPTWYSELPGGLLLDECPHMLYLLSHYIGKLQLRTATARIPPGEQLPASADISFEGNRGAGHLTMVFGAPLSEWHIVPVASGGVVDIDLFRDVAVELGPDGSHRPRDVLMTSARAMVKHVGGVASSGALYAAGRLFWGHDVLIHAFIDAVARGGKSPVPLDEAVAVVRMTDAILSEIGLRG